CSLNEGLPQLEAAGYTVVGVSKDSQESHRKFADKYSLSFPLIADTELTLNEAFGVWQKKKMAGREYMGTVRTTFIIDENGTISDIITKVQTKDSANQILKLTK
ncbi:MAG: peroxiredoxin, partial [Muribaculaceae bacterium]